MTLQDVQHDLVRLVRGEIAFFIGRNLPKRIKSLKRRSIQVRRLCRLREGMATSAPTAVDPACPLNVCLGVTATIGGTATLAQDSRERWDQPKGALGRFWQLMPRSPHFPIERAMRFAWVVNGTGCWKPSSRVTCRCAFAWLRSRVQDTGMEALPLVAALGDLGQSDNPGLWSTWISFSATCSADRMIVIGLNPAVAPRR